MTKSLEACGYIITTSEAIYGTGITREAAWKDAEEWMDAPVEDAPEDPLHREPECWPATMALLNAVNLRGGAIAWRRVGGVCCTTEEAEEIEG